MFFYTLDENFPFAFTNMSWSGIKSCDTEADGQTGVSCFAYISMMPCHRLGRLDLVATAAQELLQECCTSACDI